MFTPEETKALIELISAEFAKAATNGEEADLNLESAYSKLLHSEAI